MWEGVEKQGCVYAACFVGLFNTPWVACGFCEGERGSSGLWGASPCPRGGFQV